MNKRASSGTGILAAAVMTSVVLYLLASTPGAVGIATRWALGFAFALLCAAMMIAALERRRWR